MNKYLKPIGSVVFIFIYEINLIKTSEGITQALTKLYKIIIVIKCSKLNSIKQFLVTVVEFKNKYFVAYLKF